MSDLTPTPLYLDPTTVSTASPDRRRAILRRAVGEMVGEIFFGQMLKLARNSRLRSGFGHGGRGEEIFAARLDAELARRMGPGLKNGLSETIYNRLVKRA